MKSMLIAVMSAVCVRLLFAPEAGAQEAHDALGIQPALSPNAVRTIYRYSGGILPETSVMESSGSPGCGEERFMMGVVRAPGRGVVIAQASPQRNSRGSAPGAQMKPDEEKFRRWLFFHLQKYLNLEGAAAKRFETVFLEYSESRSRLMKEHIELSKRIADDVENESVPVEKLRQLSQRYKDINRSLWLEREAYYRKAESTLSERQMIKLIIYEDRVKDDLFRRVRREDGAGGPPDSSRPPAKK